MGQLGWKLFLPCRIIYIKQTWDIWDIGGVRPRGYGVKRQLFSGGSVRGNRGRSFPYWIIFPSLTQGQRISSDNYCTSLLSCLWVMENSLINVAGRIALDLSGVRLTRLLSVKPCEDCPLVQAFL